MDKNEKINHKMKKMSIKWTIEYEGEKIVQNPANELRGEAIKKFGSIAKFANAMHWSGRKASYITTGRQIMTVKEAEDCAEVLDIVCMKDFMRIFFPVLSIKWTNKKGA